MKARLELVPRGQHAHESAWANPIEEHVAAAAEGDDQLTQGQIILLPGWPAHERQPLEDFDRISNRKFDVVCPLR